MLTTDLIEQAGRTLAEMAAAPAQVFLFGSHDDPPVPDELDRNASLRSAERAVAWARGALGVGE